MVCVQNKQKIISHFSAKLRKQKLKQLSAREIDMARYEVDEGKVRKVREGKIGKKGKIGKQG